MAHPKRRQSKTRTLKRRTHDKAVAPTLAVCPNCGGWHIYHTVCPTCGYYRGNYLHTEGGGIYGPRSPQRHTAARCSRYRVHIFPCGTGRDATGIAVAVRGSVKKAQTETENVMNGNIMKRNCLCAVKRSRRTEFFEFPQE